MSGMSGDVLGMGFRMGCRVAMLLVFSGSIARGEVLRSAGAVRELGRERLAEEVEVKLSGVVTSVRGEEYPEFTVQDDTGAVVARLDGPVGMRVKAGQRVEIEGVTNERPPSPRVVVSRLVPGEMVGMPEPMEVKPADLLDGSKDCLYVEFAGVIRKSRIEESVPPTRLVLDFGPSEKLFSVWVSHFDDAVRARFQPDVAVKVRGVCYSWRGPNFQPFGTFVVVADPTEIGIADAPDEVRMRPLRDLLTSQVDEFNGHRERAEGVVTLVWPDGEVVLENEEGAIRVMTEDADGLKLGDAVEMSGFPTRLGGRVVLESAEVGEVRTAGLAMAEEMTPKRLLLESERVDREGRLLKMRGTFRRAMREEGRMVLVLEGEGQEFRAILPEVDALPVALEPGVDVEVSGVCRMVFSDHAKRFGRFADGFDLQLPDGRAIVVAGSAPWWTPERVMAGVLPVVAGLLGWALLMRRRAGKRSALLVHEIRARHDAEVVAAERMRLAGDLHDTLSQSLSGAAMQLEVARAGGIEEQEHHLLLARRLLDRGREDLRRAVWDLNPSALSHGDLGTALEKVAREMSGDCRIDVEITGDAGRVPERVRVHLFRVGQEALNNALRHGNPSEIRIRLASLPERVELVVADNGRGFDPATVPGPDEGHFGLRSLRERMNRLGGNLEISSSREGTIIRATAPLS